MTVLCRFCAKDGSGIDVFSEKGQKKNLYSKIKLCLPINITINDGMTTHICYPCINKLNVSYEFHSTSVAVQCQLKNMLNDNGEAANEKITSEPREANHLSPKSSAGTTNDSFKIRIEAVSTISQNAFHNLATPDNNCKENGKRSLDDVKEKETADTAKKKDRMTVCQYCRKWFPRSIIISHEKLHMKGGTSFNCILCNKDFQEADDFKKHICVGEGD